MAEGAEPDVAGQQDIRVTTDQGLNLEDHLDVTPDTTTKDVTQQSSSAARSVTTKSEKEQNDQQDISSNPNNSTSKEDIKKEQENNDVAHFINITLMMANAAQIREVVDIGHEKHHLYVFVLSLLAISVFLQIASAVLMLFRFSWSCRSSGDEEKGQNNESDDAKNTSHVLGFLIVFTVVVNILVVGFTPSPDERLFGANSTQPAVNYDVDISAGWY